jgi:tetratricopeptide (TPR) repeat protein
MRIEHLDPDEFELQVQALEAVFDLGSFDPSQAALATCTALIDRFYTDVERREQVAGVMRAGWARLPIEVRISHLMGMIEIALEHGDAATALEWLDEAHTTFDSVARMPRHGFPLLSRLAGLRFRAGDEAIAQRRADELLARYASEYDQIVDVFRGEVLRPLAEAYQVMGQTDLALTVYRRAVDEGVLNPNSRPRAADLAATCCSMASSGVEPDAELLVRIREIADGLGDPW